MTKGFFGVEVEGWSDELHVVRFSGVEVVSSPYEFRIEVGSPHLPAKPPVGSRVTLTNEGLLGPRYVCGWVAHAEYVGDTRRYAIHELLVVPWLWRLQQRVTSRIFQGKKTPEILKQVLEDAGMTRKGFRMSTQAPYEVRDYCVQYGESDLDFFNRLCESDGLIYYFDHTADGEVLVVTDRPKCSPPPDGEVTLRWGPATGIVHGQEQVTRLRRGDSMRPDGVRLRDYNLRTPEMSLEVEQAAEAGPKREVYDHPGGYQTKGRGTAHARLRMQALQAGAHRVIGTSDSRRLLPGYAFALEGHRWPEFDGEYQVLRLTHRGEQPQVLAEDSDEEFHYSNEFECIEVDVPYRAPRVTPRPAVRGVQTATVVGPPGEEIHVDDEGRVRVLFHWDRRPPAEDSSCWVRVSQTWAGNGYGAMFIPRVGHEVIVDFIEGDPDRPVVIGRIYTGQNVHPYDPVKDKSRSTIRSESTPGGGGYNELRFEDARAAEEIFMHAQRDMNVVVEHDTTTLVGNDAKATIKRDRTLLVEGHSSREVRLDETEKILGNRTITIQSKQSEQVYGGLEQLVVGQREETVQGGMSQTISENLQVTAGQNVVLVASSNINMYASQGFNVTAVESANLVAVKSLTIQCGSAMIEVDAGSVRLTAPSVELNGGTLKLVGSVVKIN